MLPLPRSLWGIVAGGAGILILGFWLGQQMIGRDTLRLQTRLAERAVQAIQEERHTAVSREINLWNEIINSRRQFMELAEAWARMDKVTGEARARMRTELDRRTAAIDAQRIDAERALNELRLFKSEWGDQPVPADIVCRVLRGEGCPDPAYPATDPGPSGALAVRGGAADASGAASVSGSAAGNANK